MRRLADKLVELKIVDMISTMTAQRSLKNARRPHLSKYWKIPPDGDAGFVAAREDVLAVYRLAHDPRFLVVCLDNLTTHDLASLYASFAPAEARRQAERLEIHHTPKHGSWLNIAAIELSARSGQCLGRRIPALATMRLAATNSGRSDFVSSCLSTFD